MSPLARRTLTALVIALALAAGCATLTKPWTAPEVVPVGLRIAALGVQRQVFVVTLAVKNPNDRTLPIKAMTYRLSLEGNALAEGASALDRPIPAFGESLVDVEVAGDLLALVAATPGPGPGASAARLDHRRHRDHRRHAVAPALSLFRPSRCPGTARGCAGRAPAAPIAPHPNGRPLRQRARAERRTAPPTRAARRHQPTKPGMDFSGFLLRYAA